MNKFLFYIVILLAFTSCKSDIKPLFTMPLEVDFEIPAGLSTILTHNFIIRDIPNPIEGFKTTYNVAENQITKINAGRGQLIAKFSETDYQFVHRVSIFMINSKNPKDRKEIYYLDFNQDNDNDNALPLLTSLSDLQSILENEIFSLEVKLEFKGTSPRLIENRLDFDIEVFE